MPVPIHALPTLLKPWSKDTRPVPTLPISGPPAALAHVPRDYAWPILGLIPSLEHFRSVVYTGPALWQIEPTIYRTCRLRGLPLAAGNPQNLPVTAELVRQLSPSIIIVADAHAQSLTDLFPQRTVSGSLTVVIRQLGENPSAVFQHLAFQHMRVLELLPGYPVAYSCPVSHTQPWHLLETYEWIQETRARIAPDSTMPWEGEITLPFRITKKDTCACGAVSVDITDTPYEA